MNKATQVVETWDRQFHCAPREQRLAFLYLANDIIQNSRRKGAEFVAEFWKVLPDCLRDVIENGDEFGRNAALRLISIWEERKVFGSRGQILKEEFVKRPLDNGSRNQKLAGHKLVTNVYGSQLDEDAIFNKCRNAISFVEKVNKDSNGDYRLAHVNGNIRDELKGQQAILRDCIEQLTVVESSRENLLSILREALQEQEYKLEEVRNQLQWLRTGSTFLVILVSRGKSVQDSDIYKMRKQYWETQFSSPNRVTFLILSHFQAAQSHSEQASSICRQLHGGNGNGQILSEQTGNGSPASQAPQNPVPGTAEPSTSVTYTRQVSFGGKSGGVEEDSKSAAAAVAAKLAASTSSAQMLTYVLSSLASEGVIGNPVKESSSDYPSEKRAKIANDHPSYVPLQNSQSAVPPFSHPEQLQRNLSTTPQELNQNEQPLPPPPPSSPPPLPPLPPPMQPYQVPQYMQTAMPMPSGPYGYNMNQQLPATLHSYASVGPPISGAPTFAPPPNGYESFPTEGGFYDQPSSLPMAPMGHQ
ncbi:UNVERIFIED_CONTAM: Regulation of nuclear pre-domain-containing protein 1B [Sesamum latifolium]|uniref:Regulation of nuclear pre-domain-containing protein 1B n=1 Tax=Sesamum latifolium TaxID=2727402 RepID=A0AAW2Y7S0_9LAMI